MPLASVLPTAPLPPRDPTVASVSAPCRGGSAPASESLNVRRSRKYIRDAKGASERLEHPDTPHPPAFCKKSPQAIENKGRRCEKARKQPQKAAKQLRIS